METPIRVAILGAGFMGQRHGQHLAQLDDAQIVAICDADLGRAEALKQKLALTTPAVFDDFAMMLDQTQLDALYICLPPFAHDGQAERAAAQGLHLFIEKPLGIDLARAESIAAAITQHGVVSQVGHHMRFRKSIDRFKALMADGSAGRPTLFQARYWCNFLGHPWWRDKQGSNGQVFEQVIHLYDLALYFLGAPQSVTGMMDNLCHRDIADYTIEDTSVSAIRFKNGSLASIVGSNCALPNHFIGDFRLVCEHAVLDYRVSGDWREPEEATLFLHHGEDIKEEHFVEDEDVYLAETVDFLRAIREGGDTRTPAQAGLAGVRLVSAVLASSENAGRPVEM